MRLPRIRFTIGRLMVAVVAAAILFAWIRVDVPSLVGMIIVVVLYGPVLAGISFDRSRGGWGIKGGAIGGSVSLSLIFVASMAWDVKPTEWKDLDLFEVSCAFGMMVGCGAAFGAIIGTIAALCLRYQIVLEIQRESIAQVHQLITFSWSPHSIVAGPASKRPPKSGRGES